MSDSRAADLPPTPSSTTFSRCPHVILHRLSQALSTPTAHLCTGVKHPVRRQCCAHGHIISGFDSSQGRLTRSPPGAGPENTTAPKKTSGGSYLRFRLIETVDGED